MIVKDISEEKQAIEVLPQLPFLYLSNKSSTVDSELLSWKVSSSDTDTDTDTDTDKDTDTDTDTDCLWHRHRQTKIDTD